MAVTPSGVKRGNVTATVKGGNPAEAYFHKEYIQKDKYLLPMKQHSQ